MPAFLRRNSLPFPCPLTHLHGVQAVLGFSLQIGFLSLPPSLSLSLSWGMLVMCCGHFWASKTVWSTARNSLVLKQCKNALPLRRHALSWGLKKGTKCKSVDFRFKEVSGYEFIEYLKFRFSTLLIIYSPLSFSKLHLTFLPWNTKGHFE